jgi:glycosyltransferase involved in cell wall biosynthesis
MTAPPLRVAHVVQNLNYGGMERLIADLVRLGGRYGLESHVIVLQYAGRFAAGLDAWGTVHECPPLGRWSLLWPGPLIRLVRRIGPDVVHSHSGVWYKASLAARRAGVPRVLHTEHGLRARDSWLARAVERRAARRTDIVACVSEALARVLSGAIVPRHAIRVVPNGVDTERFRPQPDAGVLRRALALPAGTPIIGSIGRLEPIKAYDVMIDALAALRARWDGAARPPPVLVLAGDGSERARLAAHAAARGVGGAVHLLGWRDDVHDLHAAFALFSLSSLSEGTSVSLLEAMSAGLCPVVTDVGGNPAVLGPELRHCLVPARDPERLAAVWTEALRDDGRRARDGAAARRRVEETFSLDLMMRRYDELYRGRAP